MNKPGIFIIGWNHSNFSRQCIEAIEKYTDLDVPALFIDNGSEDDHKKWLCNFEETQSMFPLRSWEFIYNKENKGISPAINQGIKWAMDKGLDPVFISNDIVVGKDWLKNLQLGVYKHDKIGAGSPYISPEFCYDGFCNLEFRENYRHNIWPRLKNDPSTKELWDLVDEIHGGDFDSFTENWSETRKELPPYFEWASMVIYFKKETIKKVGLFDEQFIPSNWEDMDYIVRMNNAKLYRIAVTGSYVFHWSNITNRNSFFDAPEEYRKEMTENEKRFHRKWRTFLPREQQNHNVKDGDKYPPKKVGPKLDEFFEVSGKKDSREHDEWWSWEDFNNLGNNNGTN